MTVLNTNDYEELMRIIDIIRKVDIESTSPEGDPASIQSEVEWLINLVLDRKAHCALPYALTISSPAADAVLEFSFSTRLYLKSDEEISMDDDED